ncbi:MAG: transketolase family protein [Treponema sp.]|jgi:transketolase|nr:transketolase family protein [Treponema sp.]
MEKANLRKAWGEALTAEGKINKDIVVLEADLGKSTMSSLFKEAFPDRYFEMGIAEQDMASTAAGFALAGKLPITGTFAVFAAGRAYDQIRCSIAIPQANVKICGSSCGLSDFGDGKTHQSVEDANIIRAMPNMTVLNPCDANEVKKMLKALLKYRGPVYIRINRNDLPVYTSPDGAYEIGKMYPVYGKAGDVCIFATGVMVGKAVEAAQRLTGEGITAQVINISTLKPLPPGEILKHAAGARAVISAEESVKTGGLGQAIAGILLESAQGSLPGFRQIAIDDAFGLSSHSYEELLEKYGLTSEQVYRAARKALG